MHACAQLLKWDMSDDLFHTIYAPLSAQLHMAPTLSKIKISLYIPFPPHTTNPCFIHPQHPSRLVVGKFYAFICHFSAIAASSTQFARTLFLLFLFHFLRGLNSATFTIVNKCSYPVWPGILSGAGTAQPAATGFALQPGESDAVAVPTAWSGRIWGRTLCSTDSAGKFSCATGDCGSSTVECAGCGAIPPATLAEFTLNGAGGLDFYDVSLVDGYNLPMAVEARGGGGGNCTATGCVADLNGGCPSELKVKMAAEGERGGEKSVACKSACEAFGDPRYCCSGAYGTPQTCKASSYSQFFKSACPRAYSYAYDDGRSTFTCASANYLITFCPTPSKSSIKSGNGKFPVAVDLWVGQAHGDTGSAKVMAVAIGSVLLTIWWQLNSIS